MAIEGSTAELEEVWAVDTGCTQHVTCQRDYFVEYHDLPHAPLIEGIGGIKLRPLGRGTVVITCIVKDRPVSVHLHDVLHCPDIGVNLVLVSRMLQKDAKVSFDQKGCHITFCGTTVSANKHRGLFLLNQWTQKPLALAAYGLTDPRLGIWHERMGHLGEQNLKKLQDLATGVTLTNPGTNSCTCEPCVFGRMKEKPHSSHNTRGAYPMEFVHMDICGPFPFLGNKGERFWATYLDDATQICEVVAVKHKNKAFPLFKQFLAQNERPEKMCHRVRIDPGGEYSSKEMEAWCAEKGIALEVTTTEQHQQNGAAEVLNRITMDKLHSTLLSSEVNKKWWPEILRAVCYLCNRSPSSVINKTPYKAWFNEKPDLSHIRTLGSTAYALKPERKCRKLADTKAIKCVLLGYEGSQIYRLLTPFGSVICTSNVHFQEKRAAVNDGNQPIKQTVPTGGAPVAENNPAVEAAIPVPGEEVDISEPATAPPPTGNNLSMEITLPSTSANRKQPINRK